MPSEYIKKQIENFERALKVTIEHNKERLEIFRENEQRILDLQALINSLKEIP